MSQQPQTIVINNFGGRLTRIINGDLNSGFAKFDTSFGYDPFTKPMNLTWLEKAQSVAGITTTIVAGINNPKVVTAGAPNTHTYVIGPYTAYKIEVAALFNSVIGVQSLLGSGDAYDWGGNLAFFGQKNELYGSNEGNVFRIGSVIGINNVFLDGTNSILTNSSYMATEWHPFRQFAGNLTFGNGPSLGAINATNTVISSIFTINELFTNGGVPQYSQLNPPLPANQFIWDIDTSVDNNYLLMGATSTYPERILFFPVDRAFNAPGEGVLYGWNGSDGGVTTGSNIPSGTTTAVETYLQQKYFFINDTFGTAVSDGSKKILTLPNNKSPRPTATSPNGNFLTWMNPEITDNNTKRVASLYYYGSLDEENPVGLYRLLRYESPLENGYVYQVPYHDVVSNEYKSINQTVSSIQTTSLGRHYFSLFNVSPTVKSASTLGAGGLFRFNVTSTSGNPIQSGVYETQTQLFSKKIGVSQVRIYVETPIAGNGFQLDLIGTDGSVIDNGTFTYTFGDAIDHNTRINFNPNIAPQYGLGVRLTNTGTTNMTIKKVELDISPEGK